MENTANNGTAKAPKRARMAPDQRRTHILDVAQKLFSTDGWDNVTIANILQETGLSKGGFYHHFTAKEDLLDGIVERFFREAFEAAQTAREATSGNALLRFNVFFTETSRWRAENGAQLRFLAELMLRDETDLLFARILAAANAAATPAVIDMITQGVEEGIFDVPDIPLAAEAIMALTQGRKLVFCQAARCCEAGDRVQGRTLLEQRMVSEGRMIDRMLGLEDGSVTLSNNAEIETMLNTFNIAAAAGGD